MWHGVGIPLKGIISEYICEAADQKNFADNKYEKMLSKDVVYLDN